MSDRLVIRRGTYRDSVSLMLVTRVATDAEGVEAAVVAMATPLNLDFAREQGFELEGDQLSPDDLLVAIRALDDAAADAALAAVERALDEVASSAPVDAVPPRSTAHAKRLHPELNLAFVSVPGSNAALEVALAIDAGLNVLCFSDGVTHEAEVALKRRALGEGLLLMGPDCGTSIIDGVGLGFANAVERGPIGIVGASGTGIQELTCLLDAAGLGISHAIGVGGRDLALGGSMTLQALDLLADDAGTEEIVVVTKPPDPAALDRVAAHARELDKPVLLAVPGGDGAAGAERSVVDAARRVAARFERDLPDLDVDLGSARVSRYVRGLFCGGTLALEAMATLAPRLGAIRSNVPLRAEWAIADVSRSDGHSVIDFGEDELTQGRAHPIIDPSLREERFAQEAADPETGVLLLDVILGRGADADPAAGLAPQIAAALGARDDLAVVVSVCGAKADPQGLDEQMAALRAAGAHVTRSASAAARAAAEAVDRNEVANV